MAKETVTKVEENAAPTPAVIRTKFQVMAKDENVTGDAAGQVMSFQAVDRATADGKFENQAWGGDLPVGSMTLEVTNPDLIGSFEAGQMYYVDITEAPRQ